MFHTRPRLKYGAGVRFNHLILHRKIIKQFSDPDAEKFGFLPMWQRQFIRSYSYKNSYNLNPLRRQGRSLP